MVSDILRLIFALILLVFMVVLTIFLLYSFFQCLQLHGWDWMAYCTTGGAGR